MRRLHVFGFLLLAPALPGCAVLGIGQPPTPSQAELTRSPPLAPGEMVRITVAGEPELGGTVAVNESGVVHMELVGDVQAAGVTPEMLAENLRQRLAAGYLKDPKVTVARASPVAGAGPAAAAAPGQPLLVGSLPPAAPPLQGSLAGPAAPDAPASRAAQQPLPPAPVLRRSQDVEQAY
jgi:hypothetical protein